MHGGDGVGGPVEWRAGRSIGERYTGRDQYLGNVMAMARGLIGERFWLVEDLPDLIDQAGFQYDWATGSGHRCTELCPVFWGGQ